MASVPCPSCGREHVGEGRFCGWCDQFILDLTGVIKRASIGRRVGAYVLDSAYFFAAFLVSAIVGLVLGAISIVAGFVVSGLLVALLGIGYLVWWLIALGKGQTPGKQLLGIQAMKTDGGPSDWGLTFTREFLVKSLLFGVAGAFTAGLAQVFELLWAFWDRDSQTLHDKIVGTYVIMAPKGT